MRSENVATCDAVVSTGRFSRYTDDLRRLNDASYPGTVDKQVQRAMATIMHARDAYANDDGHAAKAIVLRGWEELFGAETFDDGSAR